MSDCSFGSARSRLFRARPRRDPTAGTSFGSQAANATGRRFVSPAARISRRYELAAPPWWTLNQTARGASAGVQNDAQSTLAAPHRLRHSRRSERVDRTTTRSATSAPDARPRRAQSVRRGYRGRDGTSFGGRSIPATDAAPRKPSGLKVVGPITSYRSWSDNVVYRTRPCTSRIGTSAWTSTRRTVPASTPSAAPMAARDWPARYSSAT